MITKKGCEPLHSCLADNIQSKTGCEAACTALKGCVGYQYPNPAAEERIGCLLIPILEHYLDYFPEDCPNGWKNVFTEIGHFSPFDDLRESQENYHHDCYRKTWGKNI